ncbi:hypothetical protein FPQ18DRAFT_302405 [Pyronema domesticum]|nr:hypothetical protein FPQ18DRAFT_302405 [Pyronema domesticum]
MLLQLFILGLTFVVSAFSTPFETPPQPQTTVDSVPGSFLIQSPTNFTGIISASGPRKISVQLCKHKGFHDCTDFKMTQGSCYEPGDLIYGGHGIKEMTSYRVRDGCCSFFEEPNCLPFYFMFMANYRSDSWISQSVKCYDHCAAK